MTRVSVAAGIETVTVPSGPVTGSSVKVPLLALPIVMEPSVPDAPKVGVAVQDEAVPLVAFGMVPAAALVALVPPPPMGMVGRSPVAMALNVPTALVAVACRTCVVMLSLVDSRTTALARYPASVKVQVVLAVVQLTRSPVVGAVAKPAMVLLVVALLVHIVWALAEPLATCSAPAVLLSAPSDGVAVNVGPDPARTAPATPAIDNVFPLRLKGESKVAVTPLPSGRPVALASVPSTTGAVAVTPLFKSTFVVEPVPTIRPPFAVEGEHRGVSAPTESYRWRQPGVGVEPAETVVAVIVLAVRVVAMMGTLSPE